MKVSISSLVEFAEAALAADYSRLRRVGQSLARDIQDANPEEARRLRLVLNRKGVPLQASGFTEMLPVDNKSRLPLIEEHTWPTTPTFLNEAGREKFESFLEDVANYELLAAGGVASRMTLMLSGPPGTGKTLLAGHIAAHLNRKLYVARLDSLISSMLGDTAKNVRSIFDFVAGKNAILFLDELDAVAKMRDDRNELGELKRVVNTVIQGLDSLDESAVVVAATNHSQMLDKAIWRRFSYKIEFSFPDLELRTALWLHFLGDLPELQLAAQIFAALSEGMTGADIEQLSFAARRKSILSGKEIDTVGLAVALLSNNRAEERKETIVGNDNKKQIAATLVNKINLSQKDIASFLGVTRQAVSSYLKG